MARKFAQKDCDLMKNPRQFPIKSAKPGELVVNLKLGYCLVVEESADKPGYYMLRCLQDQDGQERLFILNGYFYGTKQVLQFSLD